MAGALIALKLTTLRNSSSPTRAVMQVLGGMIGLALALSTIAVASHSYVAPHVATDNLSLVLGLWWVGWCLGPTVVGEDSSLRPENFRLLPVSPRRLVLGLMSASFIGIPSLVALVASMSLVVLASSRGATAAVIAVVGALLQVVFLVLSSKVVTGLFGQLQRSRAAREIAAFVMAAVMAGAVLGPLTATRLAPRLARPWPSWAETAVRVLPSSWTSAAVGLAGRGEATVGVGWLLALTALCAALVWAWSRLLARRIVSDRTISSRSSGIGTLRLEHLLPNSPMGGVAGKELHTWIRDPLRARFLHVAFWIAVLVTVMLRVDGLAVAPLAGVLFVVVATMFGGNTIGLDGSSLWLTLSTPDSACAEVRGRQLAWLILVTPIALLMTLIGSLVVGAAQELPAAFGLCLAAIGGGWGFTALISVVAPSLKTDPHMRGGTMSDEGNNIGGQVLQSTVLIYCCLLCVLPTFAIVAAGVLLAQPALGWAALAAGAVTAGLVGPLMGRAAARRLETRGHRLLARMRGQEAATSGPAAAVETTSDTTPEVPETPARIARPATRRAGPRLGWLYLLLAGLFLLIFEAAIPYVAVVTHAKFQSRFWYLPLYLPVPLDLAASIAAGVLGAASLLTAAAIGIRSLVTKTWIAEHR